MPSTSPKQHAFMEAIAHDPAFAARAGVSQSVGREFVHADKGYADGGSVYPDQLSPDLMAQLQALGGGSWSLGGTPQSVNSGGLTFSPIGVSTNDEGGSSYTPQGYTAFTQGTALTPGAQGAEYGLNGQGSVPYTVMNGGSYNVGDFKDALQAAAVLGAMYLGGQGLAAMGAGSAGGIGGTGFAAGEGAASGVGAAAGTGAADVAGGAATFNPAMDSQLANTLIESGAPGFESFGGNALAGYGMNATDPILSNFTDLVGNTTGNGVDSLTSMNDPSSYDYTNGSDMQSDIAHETGAAPPGSVNAGVGTTWSPSMSIGGIGNGLGALGSAVGKAVGSSTGPSLTDIGKILSGISSVTGALGGGSSGHSGSGGQSSQPFDYGPAQYLPPGWRTDRPMYVPGQDAIPTGWYGAGYTSNNT